MSDKEFETRMEQQFASLEDALTPPESSNHLEACAAALRELQDTTANIVFDVEAKAEELMADTPIEELQRVMVPVLRLIHELGRWNNYVGRLLDNDFNFTETPYRGTPKPQPRYQQFENLPIDIVMQPPGPRPQSRPH